MRKAPILSACAKSRPASSFQGGIPVFAGDSMADPEVPQSLPRAERLPTLDILRGFALMGILIMNMPAFNSSFFSEADGSHIWTSRIDHVAEWLRVALFSGKFNSMFSLLFGIGFTIQFTRMQARDPARGIQIYMRRLLVLALLGVLHAW